MVTLAKSGNAIVFTFDDNDHYLNDGTIEVPVNSLTLVTDESQMATFKKSATNDIFISATYNELGMSKADLESWFKENACGSTGGGSCSGVTSGEVQTMIDESISGKADTSDVQEIASDVATVSGDVNTLSGSVESIHSAVSDVVGDVSTLSGDVANKADTSAVTESISAAVSGKMDTSAFNTYSAATDARLAEDEEVTSAGLNELNDALSGKADTTAVTASIAAAVSGKADTSAVTASITAAVSGKADSNSVYTKTEIDSALSGKQDTLIAGTNITISGNVISAAGGNNVIELTQAEYDELTDIDPDVFYIITDAAGAVTTGQVQTMIDDSISGKQDTLVSGTNIKTINNESILGSGNIDIQGGGGATYSAGRGIAIDTGNTISFDLPIWNPSSPHKNIAIGSDTNSPNGMSSVAVGQANTTNQARSFASGHYNILNNENEGGFGQYNVSNTGASTSAQTLFSVGNGTSTSARHNALEIRKNGDIYITLEGQDVKLQDQLGGGLPESAFTAYSAATDARLAEDEEVTAAGLNALNDALSDKADTSAVTESINAAVSGKADTSAFTAHTADTTIHTTSAEKSSWNGAVTALGGLKLVSLTQAQYDDLATKDASTLYFIVNNT